MNDTKFTPGPWEAVIDRGFCFVRAPKTAIEYPGGRQIPVEILGDDGYGQRFEHHRIPDAHLIAAAPDMYELLCELEGMGEGVVGAFGSYSRAAKLLDVLAKARGESNE